jgi:hypothetical protein
MAQNTLTILDVIHLFCSQKSLLPENLALRRQLFCAERPSSTPKARFVRQALLAARAPVLALLEAGTLVVAPEAVVRWHRAGFHWKLGADLEGQEAIGRLPVSHWLR